MFMLWASGVGVLGGSFGFRELGVQGFGSSCGQH